MGKMKELFMEINYPAGDIDIDREREYLIDEMISREIQYLEQERLRKEVEFNELTTKIEVDEINTEEREHNTEVEKLELGF